MTSNEYVEGAIRTESGRFDANHVDADTINTVFSLVVAAGQAMDALKRALYYGKPLNEQKLDDAMLAAKKACHDYDLPITLGMAGYSEKPAVHPRTVHAALGLVTESAEIVEKVLTSFRTGLPFDYANLFEELSDVNWYMALGIDTAAQEDPESRNRIVNDMSPEDAQKLRWWSYEAIWEKNLAKLKARYPNKFETERAYNRDLDAEKKAME